MLDAKESILFVVDGTGLEAQSLLLAASLAKHHPDRSTVDLIAYVSPRSAGSLTEVTRALYAHCGVQVQPLPSADGFGPSTIRMAIRSLPVRPRAAQPAACSLTPIRFALAG